MTNRRTFLGASMSLGLLGTLIEDSIGKELPKTMPVIFVGHGSPMNALADNVFTQTLSKWGQDLGTPKAILVVSAHWLTNGITAVDNSSNPKIIYDFGGFPQPLYEVKYPAKGNPELALEITNKIKSNPTIATNQWGLDHGAWTILKHLYPNANIPVFELSIDYSKNAQFHYNLGKELNYLRKMGVLIVGSGNIVHNLSMTNRGTPINVVSRSWAKDLDTGIYNALLSHDIKILIDYKKIIGSNFGIATPDHYYPFLYSLGAAHSSTKMKQVYEGFEAGTLAMRCVQWD